MCQPPLLETTILLNHQQQQRRIIHTRNFSRIPIYILAVLGGCILLFIGRGLLDNNVYDNRRSSIAFGDDMNSGHKKRKSLHPNQPIISLNSELSTAPVGCEATVLLLRHCDKPVVDGDPQDDCDEDVEDVEDGHCSYLGFERSQHLATIFGERWPMPYKLYAMTIERKNNHKNFRQVETLEPLALESGLEINSNYTSHESKKLANDIFHDLRDGSLCGRLVVVSWKHSRMNELALDLGWGKAPYKYKGSMYDQIWQIKFVYKPQTFLDNKNNNNNPQKGEVPDDDKQDYTADLTPTTSVPITLEPTLAPPATPQTTFNLTPDDSKRNLKKKKPEENPPVEGWMVYGSVTYQNFDPLGYSYMSGDYPDGGKKTGGGWLKKNSLN
mmetsp:Transcript_1037/g.1300  ORF Transcript_1037/g.1300 Transcript_1037/m.1300 type:complete len:384 (-) Transcript_1037:163-1314(-)